MIQAGPGFLRSLPALAPAPPRPLPLSAPPSPRVLSTLYVRNNAFSSHCHARALHSVADNSVHVKVRVDEFCGELQRAFRSVLLRLPGHQAFRPGRAPGVARRPDRPLPVPSEGADNKYAKFI